MFPLHPETPPEGRSLEELFNASSLQVSQMVGQLKVTAERLGLEFGDRHMTYNSRLAQELGIWAEEHGRGDAYHMAVFRAYFGLGENIAMRENLLRLVDQAGLPVDEAREVIDSRSYSTPVDEDWQLSRSSGITAAPTFVMAESRLVGAQDYPTLQGLMLQHGVGRR
jgi:predicted DsbA family dithiol-disulfide isomerase